MDESRIRSRRALLTAAAGGAAAVAANAALGASVVKAVDTPMLLNVPNTESTSTSLGGNLAGATTLTVTNDALSGGTTTALSGYTELGMGIRGTTHLGIGVDGESDDAGLGVKGVTSTGTAVLGLAGTWPGSTADTVLTGVYGYAVAGDGVSTAGSGVWGDSPDYGVYGSGGIGVFGDGGTNGSGLYGYSKSGYGLVVEGKVKLATRSGRSAVSSGKTSWSKTTGLTGVTSSSIVIAVLQTAETGTWVRAAVAGTNKITVYFNKALPSSSYVGWLVLN